MYVPLHQESIVTLPTHQEIIMREEDVTISRTDLEGNILFCNKTLAELSGYRQKELLKSPHSILRHPDMPQAVFYFLWQKILAGLTTRALVKNFTKEGDYYWVMLEFSALRNNEYEIISYLAKGSKPSQYLIDKVVPLYQATRDHEQRYGFHSSIRYMASLLEQENVASYSDYLYKLESKRKNRFFLNWKWKN